MKQLPSCKMSCYMKPRIWARGGAGMMEVCVQGSGGEVVKARRAAIRVDAARIYNHHTHVKPVIRTLQESQVRILIASPF